MGPRLVVISDPAIEIVQQLLDRGVNFLSERHAVELVEYRLAEAFDTAVGLRAPGPCAAVIDLLDREVEFVIVPLRVAALFGAAFGQDRQQRHLLLVEEGDHPVVEQFDRADRRLAVVELGEGDFRVGVDEGLLVDAIGSGPSV